jgi:hypothetical protein
MCLYQVKIVERIKHALSAMYFARGHMVTGSNLAVEIDEQIQRLEKKFKQLSNAEKLAEFKASHATQPSKDFENDRMGLSGCITNEILVHELLWNPVSRGFFRCINIILVSYSHNSVSKSTTMVCLIARAALSIWSENRWIW